MKYIGILPERVLRHLERVVRSNVHHVKENQCVRTAILRLNRHRALVAEYGGFHGLPYEDAEQELRDNAFGVQVAA